MRLKRYPTYISSRFIGLVFFAATETFGGKPMSIPFPTKPIAIPFQKTISNAFPVLSQQSIGLEIDEQMAIGLLSDNKVKLNKFPIDKFKGGAAVYLPQLRENQLFVHQNRGICILNLEKKTVIDYIAEYPTMDACFKYVSVADYDKKMALTLFQFFDLDPTALKPNYAFTIEDIGNGKRIKEFQLEKPSTLIPVLFTSKSAIFRENHQAPWKVLDANLSESSHPFANILNNNIKLTLPESKEAYISDVLKQAFIITTNIPTGKNMLFLASWHHDPTLFPIPLTGPQFQGRSPTANKSTLSPSGKWAYFKADGDNPSIATGNFLIYLDPALPTGYLPPFYLGFDGEIQAVTWMTNPEGLVIFIDNRLFYWDLSHFKAEDLGKGK
jgi:hypothetical protein